MVRTSTSPSSRSTSSKRTSPLSAGSYVPAITSPPGRSNTHPEDSTRRVLAQVGCRLLRDPPEQHLWQLLRRREPQTVPRHPLHHSRHETHLLPLHRTRLTTRRGSQPLLQVAHRTIL